MRDRIRLEAETMDLGIAREAFGHNSLTSVENNRAVPFRWICHIEVRGLDGKLSTGTGFLIGPRHVLTSAHVIYPIEKGSDRPRQRVSRIRVFPARHGTREPFGSYDANGWAVRPEWNVAPRVNPVFDYGLIRLKKNVDPAIGFWGHNADARFTAVNPATLARQTLFSAGYPFREGVMDTAARVMRRSEGRATRINHPRVFWHDVDTEPGQSGCPVWMRQNDTLILVGIHHGSVPRDSPTANLAVLVTQEVVNQVNRWIRTFVERR